MAGREQPRDLMRCLRCLLLVMCMYPFAKKALTLHLARGEGRKRYYGCNLVQRKVLASSRQHLIAEAPPYRQPFRIGPFEIDHKISSLATGPRAPRLYSYPTRGRPSRAAPFHRTAEDGELLPKSDIVRVVAIIDGTVCRVIDGRDIDCNARGHRTGSFPFPLPAFV